MHSSWMEIVKSLMSKGNRKLMRTCPLGLPVSLTHEGLDPLCTPLCSCDSNLPLHNVCISRRVLFNREIPNEFPIKQQRVACDSFEREWERISFVSFVSNDIIA